jgi:ABC-type Zn2+ transport system substrate-binding protein/surface adhesin
MPVTCNFTDILDGALFYLSLWLEPKFAMVHAEISYNLMVVNPHKKQEMQDYLTKFQENFFLNPSAFRHEQHCYNYTA